MMRRHRFHLPRRGFEIFWQHVKVADKLDAHAVAMKNFPVSQP